MTRCDYDTIFQRVFCVTLVAIAFTFTVILTNVFVDIDGLLSRKDKGVSKKKRSPATKKINSPVSVTNQPTSIGFAVKTYTNLEPVLDNEKHVQRMPNSIAPQTYYKAETDFDEESEDTYRSKRSLESQNFLFRIRNPKMKSILTSRLATLLEELDNEESPATDNEKPARAKEIEELIKDRDRELTKDRDIEKVFPEVDRDEISKGGKERKGSGNTGDDLLHLAMHNILLQGIVGHMDLNDVYRKIHALVNNFKDTNNVAKDQLRKQLEFKKQLTPMKLRQISNDILEQDDEVKNNNNYNYNMLSSVPRDTKQNAIRIPTNEETKFFEEIAECDKLKNDIIKSTQLNYPQETSTIKPFKLPNVLIKTIIDITSLNNSKSQKYNNSNSNENVKGIIQLIYNGQSIKFSRMEEEARLARRFDENIYHTTTNPPPIQDNVTNEKSNSDAAAEILDSLRILQEKIQQRPRGQNTYLNKLINEYLKKSPDKFTNLLEGTMGRHKYKSKRYKRQIKIRYQDTNTRTHKTKPKRHHVAKPDDDELYVEIETHFDSKGMKGDKKRKLVRTLIEKIQKAIHSDIDSLKDEKKKKHGHFHVKKRTQHPLDKNKTLLNKIMIPFEAIIQRHSDPISKTATQGKPLPLMTDKTGENWKKTFTGPAFLTLSKSMNSAELGEVDIDYSKVNKIPQRLQKPLNTEDSEDQSNTFFDVGNTKFYIKNLDGTGLSIGFNQYMDEPPDSDTMKLYTGIENIITNYHQYDNQIDKTEHEDKDKMPNPMEKEYRGLYKRDVSNNNEHVVIRRSIKELNEKDYHSNEYKIIFDSNFLPYDSYQEIIEDKNKKVAFTINKDNDIFSPIKENSKETEVIRRSIKIRELPALLGDNIFHRKLKPSEILNLASMLNRKKRGLNVKRISSIKNKYKMNKYINTRRMGTKKLILNKKRNKRQIDKIRIIATDALTKSRVNSDENFYITSDENVLADRAVIREMETPELTFGEFDVRDEKTEERYHNVVPYIFEDSPIPHALDNKFRQEPLMSKYPHIFVDTVSRSNEEFEPVVFNKIELNPFKRNYINSHRITTETTIESSTAMNFIPNVEQIVSAITPKQYPRQNYKLTVRVMPKNGTGTDSGFKEIHTSINKSFNRDGLSYSSLVNVSEISKIEKLFTPVETGGTIPTTTVTSVIPKKDGASKRIAEHQVNMDSLLKQHKKRIDEQLESLKKERMNLEAIALRNVRPKSAETFEFTTNKNTKLDLSKLLASALLRIQTNGDVTTCRDAYGVPSASACKTTTTTTTTTTPAPPLTRSVASTTPPRLEKSKLVNTIQRNENLTNEILHQINKNTEVLQMFLSKLADRLVSKETRHNLREDMKPPQPQVRQITVDESKLWKAMPVPIPYPNMGSMKNGTQMQSVPMQQIPFMYAIPQPFPINHKSIPEMPPLIPSGSHIHLHTAFHKIENPRDAQNKMVDPEVGYASRYFIDNMENEYVRKKKENSSAIVPALPVGGKNKLLTKVH